ncbi:C-type lectin domain family 4 member E [Oncorhynchus mykiss]|uniref:C-type lectin domain family 4 member E n=1 Tax=Oncorhynchus mykiss TaxID=8022 RepID=UPI0018786B46|nr:C-type lectin domain family 4 member E [Oncorhynchus mykiss]
MIQRRQKKTGMVRQGWRFFGSSWYYISTETKSWEESRKDCKRRGADLVIINSKEEQEFNNGFQKMRYWIGLSDIEMESTTTWVDGTPLTIRLLRTPATIVTRSWVS